jgi:polysaccharide deacetylase 2 family uncharacterized protein YibQ
MIKKSRWKKGQEPWPAFDLIAIILFSVAIISVVALDLISSRKNERSYLFRPAGKRPAVVAEVKPPHEAAAKPGAVPPVSEHKAEPAPAAKEKEREAPATEAPVKETPATAKKRVRGQVALIVDDMGDSLEALDVLLGLKEAVTVSILPYSLHAQETAKTAHENNLEVLLHLPLESLNNHETTLDTRGMITTAMSPDEIVQAFETNFARVLYADGVNNHMGSKFTADAALMRTLLLPLKERGLFFVDSRTTAQTVAYREALRMGIPATNRDVFLDADADRSRIKSRLIELFKLARKKGRAVGICHPYPETLEMLKTSFRQFADYDLEVVPVSRLVQK